jgi:hypothetical protein
VTLVVTSVVGIDWCFSQCGRRCPALRVRSQISLNSGHGANCSWLGKQSAGLQIASRATAIRASRDDSDRPGL